MLNFKKINKKNICFIGLMGSGKSTIAKELSNLLKYDFFDSDLEIEKTVGEDISDIFLNKGEDFFRAIEEKTCTRLLNTSDCIISLGGGSITNSKIRDLIEKNSYSIYLKVKLEILLKRLNKSNKRPLLVNQNKKKVLEKLYKERKVYYNKADLTIENFFDKKSLMKKLKMEIDF
tara:strand:- start:210 stop:734 length:525 start_codon:yes stop_codon:yes gene_type:complete